MSTKTVVAITGGTGFVGKHVVRALSRREDLKLVLLSRSAPTSGTERSDEVVNLSVADWQIRLRDLQPDIFLNFAVDYGRDRDLLRMFDANLRLPIELLNVAKEVKSRCFISCDSFYSKFSRVPAPMMDYVLMKKSLALWMEAASGEMAVLNLRLEHVYGPDDRADKFISTVLRQLQRPTESELNSGLNFTAGEQTRDFVAVADVASAVSRLVDWAKMAPAGYNTAELGSGRSLTLRMFVEALKAQVGSSVELHWGVLPYPIDEIRSSVANLDFLSRLGWKPEISLHEGLAQICRETR